MTVVNITCPYCQFSKEIPKEKIPPGVIGVTCPRCGQRFEWAAAVKDMSSVGEEDPEREGQDPMAGPEDGTARRGAPWENRSELGFWQSIFQTIKEVLFSPQALFKTLSVRNGFRDPLVFGLFLGSIGGMIGLFWQFVIVSGGLLPFVLPVIGHIAIGLLFFVLMLLVPVFVAAGIFFYSGILHLMLTIVRGGKNGYEATFRVISYSHATRVFSFIPIIGGLVSGVWGLIIQIIGLREIHDTTYLRVIGAFLLLLGLILSIVTATLLSIFILL
jgi:hypothetical protein